MVGAALSSHRQVTCHRHVRITQARAMHHRGVACLLVFALLPLLGCMPRAHAILFQHEEVERESAPAPTTRVRERHNLKKNDLEQVEPPPEPKFARTVRRRIRQLQHEEHGASSGQSGYPGSLEASGIGPRGQSGDPGPSGGRFCGDVHQDAAEFRSFVGKLYLRTHGKSL